MAAVLAVNRIGHGSDEHPAEPLPRSNDEVNAVWLSLLKDLAGEETSPCRLDNVRRSAEVFLVIGQALQTGQTLDFTTESWRSLVQGSKIPARDLLS